MGNYHCRSAQRQQSQTTSELEESNGTLPIGGVDVRDDGKAVTVRNYADIFRERDGVRVGEINRRLQEAAMGVFGQGEKFISPNDPETIRQRDSKDIQNAMSVTVRKHSNGQRNAFCVLWRE